MPTRGLTHPSGRTSWYDPLLSQTYATSSLWQTCPLAEYLYDPSIGYSWHYVPNTYDASNDWTLTQATTGTAAMSTAQTGTLLIDAGATTANQGVNLQALKVPIVLAAGKSLWYEIQLALTATTPPVTKAQFFAGMAASDTTIIAAGAMTTNNRIGHEILAAGLLATTFTCDKAGTEGTKTGPTLVDAIDIRLGGFYDGVADTIQQYSNGAALGTTIATANIPKLVVYPSLVCQSDGTDRPNVQLRSFKLFQLR